MNTNKLSNLPAVQPWIKQFLPKDMPLARQFVDELIYIKTSQVIDELELAIVNLLKKYKKVAILPVRELEDNEVSYFSETDDKKSPLMQLGQVPLGSEALISNLIKRLSRQYKEKIILTKGKEPMAPSLKVLKDKKANALILVDDLIGSGKRTNDFLGAVYHHKTIKSWVSKKWLCCRTLLSPIGCY